VMMLVYGQEMMAADDALGVTDDAGGMNGDAEGVSDVGGEWLCSRCE